MQTQLPKDELLTFAMNTGLYDDEETALIDVDFLDRLNPCPGRVLVSKPEVSAYHSGRQLDSGVIIPDIAARVLREFGLICTIFKVGPGVDPDIVPGTQAIISEFSGKPIFIGREVPYWILGEDEIMLIIADA